MPSTSRFLPCLLAVPSLWHGEDLCRLLLPPLQALTGLLAPRWWVQWSLDAPAGALALVAWPRSATFLPALALPDGALQAHFPLHHLLLPLALALAASGLCAAGRGWRWALPMLALLLTLPVFALVQGLGLVELSLARHASRLGLVYDGSPWLPLMLGLEAGGRWLPCILVAASAQARSWRRFHRHHASPTRPATSAGAPHS